MKSFDVIVLTDPKFPSELELHRAVELVNACQSFYRLTHVVETLPKPSANGSLDYNRVRRSLKAKHGDAPLIVATHLPLKDAWIAYPLKGFYIFTTGRNRARPQLPPLSTMFAYFIGAILGSLECQLTSTQTPLHYGKPIGCMHDLCDTDEDLYESMKRSHMCAKCQKAYKDYGISDSGIKSVKKILAAVKNETARYDQSIPYDVFVSYANSDAKLVRPIVERFRDERFKVWYDDSTLLPGERVKQSLRSSAAQALCFCFALSPKSVKSSWCREERRAAMAERKLTGRPRILTVMVEKCDVPKELGEFKYGDLQGKYKKRDLDLLCQAVREEKDRASKVGAAVRSDA